MKKILVMSVALTSFSAFADWSLKNENNIYDLMYLSKKGKFSSETSYNSISTDDRALTIGTSNLFTMSHKNSTINESLGYGLMDNLELSLGLGYQISDETKLKYGPASTSNGTTDTYKEKGITTPSLNVKYRVITQTSAFANGDIVLSYSPKIGTSKDGVQSKDGNALRDSSLLIAGFDLGKKYTDMAWRFGFKGNFYGSGKSEDADSSSSTTTRDSYSEIIFDGSWQWIFQSKYVLNLNAGYGSIDDLINTTSSGIKSTEKKKTYGMFGVDFKYLVSESTSLGLNITSKSYDKYDWIISTTTIPVGTYSDTSLGLSVKTEF
jgi:hypothetical protein